MTMPITDHLHIEYILRGLSSYDMYLVLRDDMKEPWVDPSYEESS